MNIAKFFLRLLITAAPLFYVDAMEKPAQLTVEPLTKLAAAAIAQTIVKDKGDVFVLLRTTYKGLPNECKADIIAAYSKLVPADQLLSLAICCVQMSEVAMSDLAKRDAAAKMAAARTVLTEKRNTLKDSIVVEPDALEKKELLKKKMLSIEAGLQENTVCIHENTARMQEITAGIKKNEEEIRERTKKIQENLYRMDIISFKQNGFLPTLTIPFRKRYIHLAGAAVSGRVACLLEGAAPRCVFARAALEIVQHLIAHEFFEDQAKRQPLTSLCLLEQKAVDEKRFSVKLKFLVKLIREALVALQPENDWVHAVQQLLLENESLSLNLLRECCQIRSFDITRGSLIDIYFWACIFDRQEIKKFIEEKGTPDVFFQELLCIIKKVLGDSPNILADNDEYYEKMKQEASRRDLLRSVCRGEYAVIGYDDLKELTKQRVPYPFAPMGCEGGYDLLDFACKMGYTECADALLAKGFKIRPDFALQHVLRSGGKKLVRKIFNAQRTAIDENANDQLSQGITKDREASDDVLIFLNSWNHERERNWQKHMIFYEKINFDAVFQQIKLCRENGIKGRFSDALKLFIDCDMAARNKYRVFDFAYIFACAACFENKEIFDYLQHVVNSEKSDLTDDQKREMFGLALCLAASKGAPLAMIQLLVESGAPVNLNQWKQTTDYFDDEDEYEYLKITGHVLYDAVNRDEPEVPDIEVVRYLLKLGARDEAFERYGEVVSACGLAQGKEWDVLAELLRPVFVERQPMNEQSDDGQSGDEQ